MGVTADLRIAYNHQKVRFSIYNSLVTDLDIVDSAIHGVVCQKSDVHGKSDIQNSKKLNPLENKSKKNSDQNKLAF